MNDHTPKEEAEALTPDTLEELARNARRAEEEATPIYEAVLNPEKPADDRKWWQKLLTPTFRRWAYGVTAAAVTAGAIWAGKPEFITVAAPLIMALFYVDKNGEPRA